MSYKVNIEIKELSLHIPRTEFPLKSDIITGHKEPQFKYQNDECSYGSKPLDWSVGDTIWALELKDFHDCVDYDGWFSELEDLVEKYKGTLVANLSGEDAGDMDYIRIRDGVKKKVKVVEED